MDVLEAGTPGVRHANPYGRKSWGVQRATFVIDRNGTISHVLGKVSPATHDEMVLGAL